jgi:signal transduction histidine kinase
MMPTMFPSPDASARLQSHAGSWPRRVFAPLNIAAYVTWVATVFSVTEAQLLRAGDPREWLGLVALLAMLALFVACASRRLRAETRLLPWNVLAQGALVVLAEAMLQEGQTTVLLIIVAAQLVLMMSLRASVIALVLFNTIIIGLWMQRTGQFVTILLWSVPALGFQAFAMLTGHFAGSSERARAHLAEVNAELLATRRLLEESARSGERLKLSRELHDIAGHSLTALKLNLARLARDPALAEREEVRVSAALADELLAQIRQVVGALRAHDGLDLRAALEALAHPVPGTQVTIAIEDGLRVDDLEQAETLLRCAQESITNALRHGRAARIALDLRRHTDALELTIENDGVAPARIEPGNGLTGMRERLRALGGTLDVQPTPPRGLRVRARLPERTA